MICTLYYAAARDRRRRPGPKAVAHMVLEHQSNHSPTLAIVAPLKLSH